MFRGEPALVVDERLAVAMLLDDHVETAMRPERHGLGRHQHPGCRGRIGNAKRPGEMRAPVPVEAIEVAEARAEIEEVVECRLDRFGHEVAREVVDRVERFVADGAVLLVHAGVETHRCP